MSFFQFAPAAQVAFTELGEIRGGEAFDLLQLLNTGHAGTLSTIHASSAKQALARSRVAWSNYWELREEAERLLGTPT